MTDRFAIAEGIDADDVRLYHIIPLGDEPAPCTPFPRRDDAAAWVRSAVPTPSPGPPSLTLED